MVVSSGDDGIITWRDLQKGAALLASVAPQGIDVKVYIPLIWGLPLSNHSLELTQVLNLSMGPNQSLYVPWDMMLVGKE